MPPTPTTYNLHCSHSTLNIWTTFINQYTFLHGITLIDRDWPSRDDRCKNEIWQIRRVGQWTDTHLDTANVLDISLGLS